MERGAALPGLLGFSSFCHNLWGHAGLSVCSHGKDSLPCPSCCYHGAVSTQTFQGQGVSEKARRMLMIPEATRKECRRRVLAGAAQRSRQIPPA